MAANRLHVWVVKTTGQDAAGFTTEFSWCSEIGVEYLILVHGFGSATGDFTLSMSDDGLPCGGNTICSVPLKTFEGTVVGTVTVELNPGIGPGGGDTWTVTYTTEEQDGIGGWEIAAANLHVGCVLDDFPQTRRGNAQIFRFDHKQRLDPPETTVTFVVPAPNCDGGGFGEGDTPTSCGTLFAAHAVVVPAGGGRSKAAWGDGLWEFPGPNFGTLFDCGCDR